MPMPSLPPCPRSGSNLALMAMESLCGSMPAGQLVAVASGGRAHAFAISTAGTPEPEQPGDCPASRGLREHSALPLRRLVAKRRPIRADEVATV